MSTPTPGPGLVQSTIRDLDRHIAAVEAERDAALARVAELETQLAEARARIDDLLGGYGAEFYGTPPTPGGTRD